MPDISRSQVNIAKVDKPTALRMGTPTGSSNRGSNSQQPKASHSVNNSQAFFQHRMSNSNTNLKHVIRSYKEEQSTNLTQQNIVVDSPSTKQIPTSKRSKR